MHNDTRADPTLKLDLLRRGLRGTLVAIALFVAVGTVTAVWVNPFFTRMTPVGPWELLATALLAALSGVTTAFWVPQCRMRGPGSGGIIGFLGIACPTCNKLLMLIFGGPALLAWFDPVRPYFAVAGIAVMGFAALRSWRIFQSSRIRGSANLSPITAHDASV